MTISAVILFGSQARGDALAGSDVDLLMIAKEPRTRHVSLGSVSIFLYPWGRLLRDSRAGDLFLCHLVRESRIIYDPTKKMAALSQAFRFRDSYADEIIKASDLGWYIARFPKSLAPPVAAKRLAWSVRTILIARAAEQRTPCFAASALSAFSGMDEVAILIARKEDAKIARDSPRLLRAVLERFGAPDPLRAGSTDDYRAHFTATRNEVALRTLDARDKSVVYQEA